MLIILYLLQLEKDTFVMQTVFIVVAWSLMHCCQQQNELALWILNWETNVEPESGTMTFTGLKYITQLWENAFVASANYHLFLILELVEHFSERVKNCGTNNMIIYVPMGFYSLSRIQISHGLFPLFDDCYFFPHQQFIIYSFICMLWISTIPSILYIHSSTVKVHEYKTTRNQSFTVSMKRRHSHVQKQRKKANATCHSECFYTAFDVSMSQ